MESESKCGIWGRWSGFYDHNKKVCEGTDIELKLNGRGEVFFFGKVLTIIDSLKMLGIQGSICNGKFIHDLIKLYMGCQFDSVCINITVEQILGVICIISKEYSFGYMVLQLGFYLSGWSYIDKTSKGTKGGEVLLLVCRFLNRRSNCIRFWKVIVNYDSTVQGIWPKFDIQVGSS